MITCKLGMTSFAQRMIEKNKRVLVALYVKWCRLLVHAAESGELAVVNLLLERSKRGGMTALLLAVQQGHWDIAKALIEHCL